MAIDINNSQKVNTCDVKPAKRCSFSLVKKKKKKIVSPMKYYFHLPSSNPNTPRGGWIQGGGVQGGGALGGRALGRRDPGGMGLGRRGSGEDVPWGGGARGRRGLGEEGS